MSRWAIAPVIDDLVVLETGAIILRLKGFCIMNVPPDRRKS